jgi:hypothetical protein
MRDDERDEAVAAHLRALDAEIARIRKLEEAIDRRLEGERGSEDDAPPHADAGTPDE